ncbi:MAG: hypothetical protein H6622_01865 [Halobacteriovoraceae bacterium]|nr:hypothetical protein [Halobacteriovoraceae bacterium]
MNKYLIASARDLDSATLCFPFLHALHQEDEQAEINIIVPEDFYNIYRALPFHVRVFEIPQQKETILGIHHFAYNLKDVFNIDTFFDFANNFKSSLIGLFFKAKNRIGNREGMRKFIINHQVERKSYLNSDSDFLSYYESNFKKPVNGFKVIGDDTEYVKNQYLEYSYFLIIFENEKTTDENLKMWKSFFKGFKETNFIIWNKDIQKNLYETEEFFKKFIEDLNDDNEYILSKNPDVSELNKLIFGSKCVFTDAQWASTYCAYFGVSSFFFNKAPHGPDKHRHFRIYPNSIHLNQNKIPFLISTRSETKGIGNMSEAIDYIHQYLNI